MTILDSLRFVQGAVASKDFVAALTHFEIKDGLISGCSGFLQLTCPIDLKLNATPKAETFVRAIKTCEAEPTITLTPAGRLKVEAEGFRSLIPCTTDPFPGLLVSGKPVTMDATKELLPKLKVLEPFISEDASRPWSRGILLRGESAYATNNVVLIEQYLGYAFPVESINLPHAAVNELLRIALEPVRMEVDNLSVTFYFPGVNRRMTTSVYTNEWPDVARILDVPSNTQPIPATFWDALAKIAPFCDALRRVYLRDEHVSTSPDLEHADAVLDVPGLRATACFNVDYLLSLKPLCQLIDFSTYPKPCIFFGKTKAGQDVRGAIIGMRE